MPGPDSGGPGADPGLRTVPAVGLAVFLRCVDLLQDARLQEALRPLGGGGPASAAAAAAAPAPHSQQARHAAAGMQWPPQQGLRPTAAPSPAGGPPPFSAEAALSLQRAGTLPAAPLPHALLADVHRRFAVGGAGMPAGALPSALSALGLPLLPAGSEAPQLLVGVGLPASGPPGGLSLDDLTATYDLLSAWRLVAAVGGEWRGG